MAEIPRGAHIYHGWKLFVYDWWVLGVVNRFAWRCTTTKHLLPLFRQNIRSNHLDVGVGTGYYLEQSAVPHETRITLCDLSPTALQAAKTRLGRDGVGILMADCTQPLPSEERFDSVSMFYLIHCLPGPVKRKLPVFSHIKRNMTADGVLAGATVLGPEKGVVDGWFRTLIRGFCKREGIMDNDDDNEGALTSALHENFETVETRREGAVLLWKAECPKKVG